MKTWFKKNKSLLFKLIGTVFAIVLLIVLMREQWGEIVQVLQDVSPGSLILAFILMMLSRFFVVGRWYVLLRSGGVDISLKNATILTFTGLFSTNFLPTTIGGDVIRTAGAMQMGYDRATCLASIVADRLIGMIGMSMAAPLGIINLMQAGPLHSVAVASLFHRGWDFLKRTLRIFSLWLYKPLAVIGALAFTWGHMICLFSVIAIVIKGANEDLPFWTIAGLWSLVYFISLVPISINGYGVQELTLTYLFSHIGGISLAVSATVALLVRVLMMTASLPGAIFLPTLMTKLDKSQLQQ